MLSIGLMSGTSMDGIDAVLLETDGSEKIIKYHTEFSLNYHPFSTLLLKAAELAVQKSSGNLVQARNKFTDFFCEYLAKISADKIDQITTWFDNENPQNKLINLDSIIAHSTNLHLAAVNLLLKKSEISHKNISVIGYHGQTLFHAPKNKISIIVGDGQQLANQTGIPVVNNFRQNDIQAGGQGAPFAPLYHQALAINRGYFPVAIVNCGGIANVTLINDADPESLIAFDTGPGNGLLDRFVQQQTKWQERMDVDGNYAKQGQVNLSVLSALYQKSIMLNEKNYFNLTPPKSLDINNLLLIPELFELSMSDACRTLAAFTADSIVESVLSVTDIKKMPTKWILAGGGWHNKIILAEFNLRLTKLLGDKVQIITADSNIDWHGKSLEAQIFAWLAVRSLKRLPLSMPNTTGVKKPMTGGELYLPA